MSKARLVITAVVVEGRTVSEAAAAYGVSRSWAYELVARYRVEGDRALEPRSRRPKNSPRRISDETVVSDQGNPSSGIIENRHGVGVLVGGG